MTTTINKAIYEMLTPIIKMMENEIDYETANERKIRHELTHAYNSLAQVVIIEGGWSL